MELFRLLGTVAIENSEANKAIDETTEKAESSHSRIGSAFEKIGSAAVAVGKTIAAGLAVGTAAVTALTKSSLDGYADYEQLVGGVETLFKTSAKKVQEYADAAYKTAGLSANEYMETVTSFSASLLQGLSGDTQAAADMADMAIVDMADNANKMGSDMSSIQNAYMGFAKQNYSMLDNLKLGYGGTQAEMHRLLQDAALLDDEFASTAKFSIDNKGHLEARFGDIVQAIHIVQSEMGITGTTALEASETISGSLASAKSAWKNLLTGLGNEDADLSGLTDQFIVSVETAARNILPRIKIILGRIVDLAADSFGRLKEKLPELWANAFDKVDEMTGGKLSVLKEKIAEHSGGISEAFSSIWAKVQGIWNATGQPIFDGISYAFQYVKDNWDVVSESISTAFGIMWDYCQTYWENIGQPIWDMISFAVNLVVDLFKENMPAIMGFFQDAIAGIKDTWENHLKPVFEAIGAFLNNKVKPAFEFVWEKVIGPLIETVFSLIGDLWNNTLKPVFDGICDFITGVFTLNWEKMGEGILGIVGGLWEGVKSIFSAVTGFLGDIFGGMKDKVTQAMSDMKAKVEENGGGIKGYLKTVGDSAKQAWEIAFNKMDEITGGKMSEMKRKIEENGGGIEGYVKTMTGSAKQAWEIAFNKMDEITGGKLTDIKNSMTEKLTAAKDRVLGIFDKIRIGITNKIEGAKNAVKRIVDKIKSIFDFDFELPKIKMPHFSISPAGWKIGDLLDGTIPSLGIEWYAKGGVMEKPTVFGRNGNNAMVGGEAEAEAIAPISTLQEYIAEAVASQNAGLVAVLEKILGAILSLDENMGGNMREALEGTALEVNHREFARLVKAVN